jgi:mycofactocin system FadH/OYE family oxidoreductase 2
MFDRLFSPLKLGNIALPNRVCFLAHRTNFAHRGCLNERHVAYYRRRAEGGCGLIIVGEFSIHPGDSPWATMIELYQPEVVEGLRRLTDAVHEHDVPLFAQLGHHGFQSNGAITRKAVWGPSAMADIAFGETAKPMEAEDMAVVSEAFVRAAELVKAGGFDGLEIDVGAESLLRQFLSPLSNHRQDEYGGSLENRMRFPLEVVEAVRMAVGEDYTCGVRLCVDEKFWGAITTEESTVFAQKLEEAAKIDFVNTTLGTYYNLYLISASMHTPEGFAVDLAEQMKASVSLPVIAGHQITTLETAENTLAAGQADGVGFVRSLICDPDFAKKTRAGQIESIRPCIKDNEGCVGRINRGRTLSCTLNPNVGFEKLRKRKTDSGSEDREAAGAKKKVMIVGAGPGGMEAAIAAREKGHHVTVYEREATVGGQINLARKGAGRQSLAEAIRYQSRVLERLQVPVETGFEVTPDFVLQEAPDVVIVATGSRPVRRPVAGNYGPPEVLNVHEVLLEKFPMGERVLFVDENGGHHATATVEWLADLGNKVDMVTSELFIGIDLAPIGDLYLTRQRLLQKGVTFICDVRIDEIQGTKVRGHDVFSNEPVVYEGYETIVLDMGNEVEAGLYWQLKGKIKGVRRIGDCVAPRGIGMAIFEGRKAGEGL